MHSFLKTTTALALTGLIAASCSQSEQSYEAVDEAAYEEEMAPMSEAAPSADMAGGEGRVAPGITPTAAPGVAFNYRYAFRLPNNQIAAVQERHAAACEELGIDRCRITGMRYRLVNETDVSAMLEFRLDPAIARSFGREAGEVVTEAEGMLVDAEISGVDEGANIARAERERARIQEDIRQLEARLATPGLSDGERVQLTQQLERLTQSRRSTEDRVEASEESLATTPMVFQYGSGDIVPGFDSTTPMRDALRESGSLFFGTIAFFIIALGAILPWAVLLLLIWIFVRKIRPLLPKLVQKTENETNED